MYTLPIFKYFEESYRGRKASGPVSALSNAGVIQSEPNGGIMSNSQTSRPSPQPAQAVHMLKQDQQGMTTVQQQPMTPMPFYADPNRFATPVWQTDPSQAWTQGQFIQQIPAASHTPIEGYQQYSNGIYQATYQQPAFETNTFYTGAVQVLTNSRPPSNPNQSVQTLARANSNYSHHTPSPVSQQSSTPQSNPQRNQYQEYSIQNQNYIAPATTPTGNVDSSQQGNQSRPSSVNSVVNGPTVNQNFNNQQGGTVFTSVNNETFSPNANTTYANANSGNDKPGYPQVNSNPQLVSHNSSGYPGGGIYSGDSLDQQMWQQSSSSSQVWEPGQGNEGAKEKHSYNQEQILKTEVLYNHHTQNNQHYIAEKREQETNLPSDRVNLNTKIKTMILNKKNSEVELNEKKTENHNTGHFLWYSHQRYVLDPSNAGGFQNTDKMTDQSTDTPSNSPPFNIFKTLAKQCENNRSQMVNDVVKTKPKIVRKEFEKIKKHSYVSPEKLKMTLENEPPPCHCIQPNQITKEPGIYYTHLGCSDNLKNLRIDLESKTGMSGKAIRIEKVRYTGKEGKTNQGCPIAKWILRRSGEEEKYLVIVKHRQGHFCQSAFIIICMVVWEGIPKSTSNDLYDTLAEKLNRFGIPTKRRCGTNDPRTCGCQGLDPDKCGASFSFGCSWSMYYNGCKFTRSKFVRKFRLNVQPEEELLEGKLQNLATHISPIYSNLAPVSFRNQTRYEEIASDCRLGLRKGRPFSGVTACVDFCAHAHKDSQNMNNGCTAVVTLTKHRSNKKPSDEQLHVLPLYVIDNSDEYGSVDNQQMKIQLGSIEVLKKYSSEIRMVSVPLEPCKRKNKRKSEENSNKDYSSTPSETTSPKKGALIVSQDHRLHCPSITHNNGEYYKNESDTRSHNTQRYNPGYFKSTDENNSRTQNDINFDEYSLQKKIGNHINYPPVYSELNFTSPSLYQKYSDSNCFDFKTYPNHNYSLNCWEGSNLNATRNILAYTAYTGKNYSTGFSNLPFYKISNPFEDVLVNQSIRSLSCNQVENGFSKPQRLYSDNSECFQDPEVGGVAIALEHGSLLFECAKHELHATTALKEPNRQAPTRISLVFYQHRNLNKIKHGLDEYYQKIKLKNGTEGDEIVDVPNINFEPAKDLFVRSTSLPTFSWTTLFPMHPCITTGPYQIIK